jgi:hypothetical protein
MNETPPMPIRRRLAPVALALACVVVAAGACGRGGSSSSGLTTSTAKGATGDVVAVVASYELVAGDDQRFLTGLSVSGTGEVVSFGTVDLNFFYLGTRDAPIDPGRPKGSAKASFIPVAGQKIDASQQGPRVVRPSEGLGVYEATAAHFDAPGFWGVRVTGTAGTKAIKAESAFEVLDKHQVPAPGGNAPRTANPTVQTAGRNDPSLDSRAGPDAPLPDDILHSSSIAAALDAHKPVVVVVSTPVYCVSKFCGPITDAVALLAEKYKDKAVFVHLEVWKNFEAKQLNPAAAEWIRLPNGDAQEPWVFFVRGDGTIAERFDNVASDAELDAATQRLVGP